MFLQVPWVLIGMNMIHGIAKSLVVSEQGVFITSSVIGHTLATKILVLATSNFIPGGLLIVGSGVRPHPFYFTPTLFIKAPLILKIPDPHPFSNLYVSYIHFWCHGNVVDCHPIALLIYHFTYFQPEDIPIFSISFCKYECTTWKSEEPHPL